MARTTTHGEGFTLIELLVVMAIVATLLTLVAPQYFRQHERAQETVLRHNLSTIRQALDQYMEDRGAAPATLDELVQRRYLREIPVDPIAGSNGAWRIDTREDGGVADVHSSASGTGLDGTEYASW